MGISLIILNNFDKNNTEVVEQFDNIALEFCNLHDKITNKNNIIENIINWEDSRLFFIKQLNKSL